MPNPATEHHFSANTSDLALDKAIAARIFGHTLTDGPNNTFAVTAGAGSGARLVELLPVSTDLAATWKAVTVALSAGHANGLHTGVMRQPDGALEYRAICAALLALYGAPAGAAVPGAMLYSPHSRVLH